MVDSSVPDLTPPRDPELLEQIACLEEENALLRQKIDLLVRKLFGAKSEQLDPAQLLLLLQGMDEPGKAPEPVAAETPRAQQKIIDHMLALIAGDPVPERPGRSEPRAKKRRGKNYQLLTKPRGQVGNLPRRNRPKSKRPKIALS